MEEETYVRPSRGVFAMAFVMEEVAVFVTVLDPAPTCMFVEIEPEVMLTNLNLFLH